MQILKVPQTQNLSSNTYCQDSISSLLTIGESRSISMMKHLSLLLLLTLLTVTAHADVLTAAEDQFSIRIAVTVPTDRATAYRHFLNVGAWWNGDHTWFGNPSGLYIEPFANGCFCEKNGDRTALHMTVSYVDPTNQIKMIGGLGPLQGLGLHGAMSFNFKSLTDDTTEVTHYYRVLGNVPEDLIELAPIVDSVQQLQMNSLENFIKKETSP